MSITTSTSSQFFYQVIIWLRVNQASVLLVLTLILFTSKSLYNLPVVIMAIIGIARCIKSPRVLFLDPTIRIYSCLFLALWVPLLFSLPDAVNFSHSARTVFPYLRFLFMGIYILDERNRIALFPLLRQVTFWVTLFWSVDGVFQYLIGYNLFGFPHEEGHITGMFYPDNTITHILAALSPLYFDSIRRYSSKYPLAWLLILPLFAVVLLGGRRAAWIMLAISIIGYLYFLFRYTDIWDRSRYYLLVTALSCISLLALLIYTNHSLQNRILTTAGLFSMDYELTDQATARRLPIWETSLEIIRNHWINGIGPRGFRHVYPQYSTEDNYFHNTGTTHPHQLLLEVVAETGILGLIGLLGFIYIFYKNFLANTLSHKAYPAVLCVLIIMFPLSSSLAFYGSYWSSVVWWFLVYAFLSVADDSQKISVNIV